MTKASDNEYPSVLFDEQGSDPSTPASGLWRAFFKSDGLYIIDDAGTVTGPLGAGGSGNVATDPIWDAKGDLAGGTGANAASRLAVGANGTFLEAQSGQATGLKWSALGSASWMQTAADYTIASGTFADIDSDMALTITTGARRVLVCFTGTIQSSVAGDQFAIDVLVDGASISGAASGFLFGTMLTTANRGVNASFSFITAPQSAGSHTFKPQWRRALGSGTLTLFGTTAVAVSTFSVAELP